MTQFQPIRPNEFLIWSAASLNPYAKGNKLQEIMLGGVVRYMQRSHHKPTLVYVSMKQHNARTRARTILTNGLAVEFSPYVAPYHIQVGQLKELHAPTWEEYDTLVAQRAQKEKAVGHLEVA